MPDPNLTAAIKEAYASVPSDVVIMHTLSLGHPNWKDDHGAPVELYFIREHQAFTAALEPDEMGNGGKVVTFQPAAFDLDLPKVDTVPMPEVIVRIDNVGGELLPWLDLAAPSKERIMLTYRPYLSNITSRPQMIPPLQLTLAEVSVTALTLQGRARLVDIGNRSFPNVDYTLEKFPSLANY